MNTILVKFLRFNPSYFAFFSGVLVSLATNVYTSVATTPSNENKHFFLLAGSGILLVSGLSCSILAWNLEKIYRVTYLESPTMIDSFEVWTRIVNKNIGKLSLLCIITVLLSTLGLIIINM